MKWDVGQKKVMICQVEDKTRWFLKEDQEEPGQGWVSERSWLALHAMDVPSNSVCIQQSTRGPSTEPCQQATDCIRLCSCLVAQSCPILCNLIDCSPPGSSVHGVPQARILEWVAILFSRVSSWSREWTQVSHIAGRFFTIWATREAWLYQEEGAIWMKSTSDEKESISWVPPGSMVIPKMSCQEAKNKRSSCFQDWGTGTLLGKVTNQRGSLPLPWDDALQRQFSVTLTGSQGAQILG